jgi:hypothetical protein
MGLIETDTTMQAAEEEEDNGGKDGKRAISSSNAIHT